MKKPENITGEAHMSIIDNSIGRTPIAGSTRQKRRHIMKREKMQDGEKMDKK